MKENFLHLCRNKLYTAMVGLTAVCSYGFLVTHQTVGIDDTPYAYYFEEGLNVIVGRWFLFLLNKVFHVSEFTPFLTDLAGVLLFMAAVTVWCALLRSICGDRVPVWGYAFFSCIFLSCPLIAEVYTYYLHNGVSVGYLCTGLSLYFFKELTEQTKDWKKALWTGMKITAFLVAALGCYESFMIVWLLGVFLVLLTKCYMGIGVRVIASLVRGAVAAAAAIVLRSVMIAVNIACFGLGDMQDEAVSRSVMQMAGWMFEPGAFAEFAMVVKRVFVMYGVFAYAYYPVKVFLLAVAVMAVGGGYYAIRRKNGWIALLTFGSFLVSFLLVVVEGKATLYRSAQFLPVICGYGAFLAAYGAEGLRCRKSLPGISRKGKVLAGKALRETSRKGKVLAEESLKEVKRKGGSVHEQIIKYMVVFALCVVLWNQCFDINRWFYVDWMKYESAVEMAGQIACRLEQQYDISKPVVFTGTYQVPRGIIGDAYVGYNTETFYRMKRLTDLVDEHLLDKFYREYGVWVAQTPALSVLDWGVNAFGNDAELVRFFAMHGYELVANMDAERFEAALQYSIDWPGFPQEGSIADMGDYIIVHF